MLDPLSHRRGDASSPERGSFFASAGKAAKRGWGNCKPCRYHQRLPPVGGSCRGNEVTRLMRAHRQTALLKQKTVLPRQDRRTASSGLRFPASAATLGRVLHPADRCPNSSSLFPPTAAVVAVALGELGSRILNAHPVRPLRGSRRTCAVVLPSSPGMQQQKNGPAEAGP